MSKTEAISDSDTASASSFSFTSATSLDETSGAFPRVSDGVRQHVESRLRHRERIIAAVEQRLDGDLRERVPAGVR